MNGEAPWPHHRDSGPSSSGLLGVVPGSADGRGGRGGGNGAFSFEQSTLTLVGRPLTLLLLTTLAVLLVVRLSRRPGLRAVRRMDLAEVVRERTG